MKTKEELKERFSEILDLRFGEFECGEGWYDLLWETLEKIEKCPTYNDLKNSERGFKIPIIKEKYGSLRIQYWSGTEEIHRIVQEAEEKSERICEQCSGDSTVRMNGGWYSSVCNKCLDRSDKEL